MANLYTKNMELLEKNVPFMNAVNSYLKEFSDMEDNVQVRDGVPYFKENEEWYAMRSRDAYGEAERILRDIEPYKDYLIVLCGMGNPQVLQQLVNRSSNGTKIFIVEKNPYILKYIFSHVNFEPMLEGNKFVLCYYDEKLIDTMSVVCVDAGWENLSQNIKAITMPYTHLYDQMAVKTIKSLSKTILTNLSGLGNSVEDMINGLTNEYQNVDACIEANGLEEIKGKYNGFPGIVVSAGPSLDKNIELLKKAYGKAVIITTDAANRACQAIGVRADAIASIERDIPTYNHFYKNQELDPEMVFVGPSLVWPDILKEYPGKKVLLAKTPTGVDGWWGSFFEQQEHILQGFSCSNVAHAILMEMGCDPIILIGQDFALTGNKRHSENSKYFKNNDTKILTKENHKNWVEGVDGEEVPTTGVFNQFREMMEAMILANKQTVIDATEGGAKIVGTKVMSFEEAIATYCTKELPCHMNSLLKERKVDDEDYIRIYKNIIDGIDSVLKDADDVLQKISSYCKVINSYEESDFESMTEEELVEVVLNLQRTNEVINYLIVDKQKLITYYQQNLKQTVIYVKKIGNELTAETVKRNWELQMHLMYLMEVTTRVVIKEYGKAKAYMVSKLEERQ